MELQPDPTLSPNRAERLRRRLFAATFGRADFRSAKHLCQWLLGDDIRVGNEFHRSLWTALAVVYSRPFTANEVGQLPKSLFERFDDERQDALHRMLWSARNRTFAHTGVHPGHGLYVMPPGSFSEHGDATIGRIPFGRETVPEIESLCDLQIARADQWIANLVESLYGYRVWPEGTRFQLDFPGKSFAPAR